MKIYGSPVKSYLKAAGLENISAPVISIVGAGGKTSLIRNISEEYSALKLRHGIFTTTHMWPMDEKKYRRLIGRMIPSGKVGAPEEWEIQKLFEEKIPVLIEADGSHGFPCKAPEAWEPVIRPETTHVIGVLGASCLGKSIIESCHRPERVMDILGCGPEHRLNEEDLAELALSRQGLRKEIKADQWYGLVINQVDNDEIYQKAYRIRELLFKQGIEQVFFVHMK